MLDRLPPEIKTDILSLVPVESLLRFRCVSKSWCAQIDNPNFIKTHLKKSVSNLNLFFADSYTKCFYMVNLDKVDAIVKLDNPLNFPSSAHHDVPFNCPTNANHNIKLMGSGNGLICLGDAVGRIVLMNPVTRKHQVLPFLLLDAKNRGNKMWSAWSFGFGYDPISDDYKVVRLGQYLDLSDGHFETETLVYNLKDNAWREIPGMSYMLGIDQKMGVLVGDALHWLVSLKFMLLNPNHIVGFDVRLEQFREVPAPRIFVDQNAYASLEVVTLGVVGEWLSVNTINGGAHKRLDVWVMKEYGVKESWTKLFSVTSNELSSLKCTRTSAFSNNGYELLLGLWNGNLVWYNLKEKSVRKVNIHGSLTPFVAEIFRGSLVPVGINKETDMKKDRKGRKNRRGMTFSQKGSS